MRADVFDDFPFLIAEAVLPQVLASSAFATLDAIDGQLQREYRGASPYRARIVGNLLLLLLLRLKETFCADYDPVHELGGEASKVRTFRRNLEAHFRRLDSEPARALLQLQDLARLQQLHPTYLSTVVRRKTGETPSAWRRQGASTT